MFRRWWTKPLLALALLATCAMAARLWLARKALEEGNASLAKGDMEAGIASLTDAIRFNPRMVVAYNNRAYAYNNRGDLDSAVADCDAALRLDPESAEAYNIRGGAYQKKGDVDRAIADYTEAIRLNPEMATAYNNRGSAYKIKGDLDQAIAVLRPRGGLRHEERAGQGHSGLHPGRSPRPGIRFGVCQSRYRLPT
jgi:tetratricopeptide (TPR) repeat protein